MINVEIDIHGTHYPQREKAYVGVCVRERNREIWKAFYKFSHSKPLYLLRERKIKLVIICKKKN